MSASTLPSVPHVPRVPRQRAAVDRPVARTAYLRGMGPETSAPAVIAGAPRLRDVSDDVLRAWAPAIARTIEEMQNNGWIAGGVEQVIATIIGTGLKLNAQPDHVALGWTASQAAAWARRVELRYEARCRNKWEIDAEGRYTSGQLEAAHLRQFLATGEGLSQITGTRVPGVASRTRVRLLPSHWMTRDSNEHERLHQGVYVNRHGAPIAYRIRIPGQRGYRDTVTYRVRDRHGRPMINHIFDGMAKQYRGITIFAPVLRTLGRYDRLTALTLRAAFLQTMFAATIESDYPTGEVVAALGGEDDPLGAIMASHAEWHANSEVDITIGDYGKIPHLSVGEKLNLQASNHPNSNYEPAANFFLREVARCLGCLVEDLTGDYRGATYSSLHNGRAMTWPITLYRRANIAVPFKQADYEAWLEEDIDLGMTPFPGGVRGFVENRTAATRAEWRGPPKPVADELKAARSDEIYYKLGVKSQSRIAADRGDDIQDVHEQLARERDSRRAHDLAEPVHGSSGPGDQGPTEEDDHDDA